MPPTVDGYLLLGWMEKDEAVYWLMNDCWFDPPLSDQQAIEIWEKYRKAVEALPERNVKKPEQFPIPPSLQTIVNNFILRTRGSEVTGVANINPLGLLVYQLYVVADRADHHAKKLGGKEWAECCLQLERPLAQMPLRSENEIIKVTLPHGEHMFAAGPGGFGIQQGAGWISVCEMQGRLILKAGYHRSFACSRRLMKEPEAKERSLLVAVTNTLPPPLLPTFPKQGLRTTVLGSRAPLLSDFFDESLAMAVKLRRKRYEMHIRVAVVGVNET
jgi:hypothetical protein